MLLLLLVDLLCVPGVAVVCLVDHFVYYYHPEKLATLVEVFYSVDLVLLLQAGGPY